MEGSSSIAEQANPARAGGEFLSLSAKHFSTLESWDGHNITLNLDEGYTVPAVIKASLETSSDARVKHTATMISQKAPWRTERFAV
jgi:hypothetical protein